MRHERIVVVEDEAIVALDLKGKLEGFGYEVCRVVDTGEDAMRAAEELRPDLVLMDIRLAGPVDGVEAAAWIGEQLRIPVIFLTAHSDDTTLLRAKAAEPADYMLKPVGEQELHVKLDMALYKHEMDKVLREGEARYAAVIQQCGEGIFLVDVDGGRVLEANPALQRMLGYGPGEIEEMTLYEIFTRPREAIDQEFDSLRERRTAVYEEEQFRRSDGSVVEVEANACLISYGESEALCLVVRDVTARKRAEVALQAAEEELQRQRAVSVRMDRLRALGEIAVGIAHEFSQPLVGVRGLAEYLLLSLDKRWELREEELRERLALILKQADRMVVVLEHVHAFYHDTERTDLLPVQLNDVVGAALDLLREQFQAHGVDLGAALADDLPPVLANPFSLEEVVLHLLANGRDAVEDKGELAGARVEVRTGRNTDGTEVWVAVEDNGVGIPEGLQSDVFTPFYTTKRPERGTGLGMVLSRSIVEQLGGRIELRSELGQGTTVTFRLPAAK